jgi:hypothetical protein
LLVPQISRFFKVSVFFLLADALFALFLSQTSLLFERIRPGPLAVIIIVGVALMIKLRCSWLCFRDGYIYLVGAFFLLAFPSALFISGAGVESLSILIIGSLILLVAPVYWYVLGVNLFAWACALAIVGSFLIIYRIQGLAGFMEAGSMGRLNLSNSHPNLLGYCAMIFTGISLILIVSGRWFSWIFGLCIMGVSFLIMIKASSRGSLIATSIGLFVFSALLLASFMGPRIWRRYGTTIGKVVLVIFSAAILFGVLAAVFYCIPAISSRMDELLYINDEYRGIDSGMSGRIATWSYVWSEFSVLDFLAGIGVRETERMGLIIDNSYVVMVLENGVFSLLAFVVVYIVRFRRLVFQSEWADRIVGFACAGLLISVLANNFVARYLFGVGNVGSVIALLALGYIGRISIQNQIGGRSVKK